MAFLPQAVRAHAIWDAWHWPGLSTSPQPVSSTRPTQSGPRHQGMQESRVRASPVPVARSRLHRDGFVPCVGALCLSALAISARAGNQELVVQDAARMGTIACLRLHQTRQVMRVQQPIVKARLTTRRAIPTQKRIPATSSAKIAQSSRPWQSLVRSTAAMLDAGCKPGGAEDWLVPQRVPVAHS